MGFTDRKTPSASVLVSDYVQPLAAIFEKVGVEVLPCSPLTPEHGHSRKDSSPYETGSMTETAMQDLVVHGDIALADGTVLRDGWLGITNGLITGTSATPLSGKQIVRASGHLILPGFVDAHVHTRSCVDEGITATTRAAAAGGTTTIVDMPFDKPARPVNSLERFKSKVADIGDKAIVDVGLYATFPPKGDLDMIAAMAEAGAVGFKVSTIEVDPVRFPRIPDGRLYEAFQEIANTDRPVTAHQENQEIILTQAEAFQSRAHNTPIDHALSRPPVAEAEAAGRLLELAYWTGVHLHMVHGTLPRTFELIEWNRSQGVQASGETCIQYLLLNMDALREQGGRMKCNPPLRSQEDVEGLWEQVSSGLVDIVTSDHSPYPLHQKECEDIFEAYAGMPGVETLGTLLYSEGVTTGRIGLTRFLELVSSGPADLFGFGQKGRLQEGADGDFVIFDPNVEWTLDENAMHYAVEWSPYHGWPLRGRVVSTWLRGHLIANNGEVIGKPGIGQFTSPTQDSI